MKDESQNTTRQTNVTLDITQDQKGEYHQADEAQDQQSMGKVHLKPAAWNVRVGVWSRHRCDRNKKIQFKRKVEGRWTVETDDVTQHSENPSVSMGMGIKGLMRSHSASKLPAGAKD